MRSWGLAAIPAVVAALAACPTALAGDPLPTTTTLGVSASTVTYGKPVTLNAHVSGATSGTIALYETPYGSSQMLLATVPVNASGNASFVVEPTGKTTYTAEFQESATHESSSSPDRTISVRSKATATLSGFYRRSGKYRLYRPGRDVNVRGTVTPNHYGHSLKFVAERYRDGKWRKAATGSFPIQYDGSAYAVLSNAARGKYRQRVVFAGDADHLGSKSRWVYLKVTR
jgi:Bacterial Ig-like domain (group 3)